MNSCHNISAMYLPANCFRKFCNTAPTQTAKRSSSNFPQTKFRFHFKDSYPFSSSNQTPTPATCKQPPPVYQHKKNTTNKDRFGARSFHYEAQHATNVQTTTTAIIPSPRFQPVPPEAGLAAFLSSCHFHFII